MPAVAHEASGFIAFPGPLCYVQFSIYRKTQHLLDILPTSPEPVSNVASAGHSHGYNLSLVVETYAEALSQDMDIHFKLQPY